VSTATAIAHPNIALCKYWGKRDRALNLPTNGSLSLTLAPFHTRTTVTWGTEADTAALDGRPMDADEARKVFALLDRLDGTRPPCRVESTNSFPTAAGLASSASGFAALAIAAAAAAGVTRTTEELAVLARRGSGSATRSLHGGWVAWPRGMRIDGGDSHGIPLAPADHWDVRMVVAIVASGPKPMGSTAGMNHTVATSPYFAPWVESAEADLPEAREAVLARDLERLGRVVERSAMRMHASMIAADPPLCYWRPQSLAALEAVRGLRARGIGAWATMDAGPNVKALCLAADAEAVTEALRSALMTGGGADRDGAARVELLTPGGAAHIVPT
jgi:diphosphomevalonate decarboxylase